MTFGRWVPRWTLGAVAGILSLGALNAQAAPLSVGSASAPATVQQVQFFYDGPDYYDPPPRRYYGPPPRHYGPPPPRGGYYPPPPRYSREAQKEYMKDYRRAQKEMTKDQIRAWNRRNGF
ncbi:hypothetical protein [Microvirga sp. 17 mud 1-3]|uniref:hypothetical protein n=1 Tax=Microvirga sp. 17 mud 1-3 TaxID=2082949 RepID=UPI000D6AFE4A|nr:hypothetical protein [Microvirga sp. 17 mud 1-3]AWM86819.1 hypothetical protein C4E04_08845 [Microvirga sp. 17 mud 1-3]